MINQKYTELNDGLKIPTVGFGTWKISDEEAPAIVEEALAAGYRSIDTATAYGNESGVGKAIADSSVSRAEIFLATKVWHTDQGYDSTLRAMESSLKKLKTDYVDLYLIHWPMPAIDKYVATWKALNRLRTEGIARSIGVCNFPIEYLERLISETGVVPVLNQIELHPYFQQKELRDFHVKHNIATEAWSPLARGKLFEDKIIVELSIKYNKTPAQIVLRWHFENGIIAIPKSSTTKRILENIDIFDFNLSSEDLARISSMDDTNGRTSFDPRTVTF
jgi:2,5-diketo-D-gluconate reductase A